MSDQGVGRTTRWPRCRVRVRGVMGPTAAQAFRGFRVTHEGGCTLLEGPLRPGYSLVSLLMDLQAFGLEVVDIRRNSA